jgi:hypothetical protein
MVFPRLVARNLGDGRAIVVVSKCPGLISTGGWAAFWRWNGLPQNRENFWRRYAELLTVIARARGEDGHPNFEAHKITRLYAEVAQAAHGTRWVWALTFASCIEALANMLEPPGRARPDDAGEEDSSLIKHINTWVGDGRLKEIAVNAVGRALKTTTIDGLRRLKAGDTITADQLRAWELIRNAVTHGRLVSPYSSEEEDRKLLVLAEMMHALTLEILRRSASRPPTNCSGPT